MGFPVKVVDPKLWEEVMQYAREHGAYEAAKLYAVKAGFNKTYLYEKLKRKIGNGRTDIGEENTMQNGAGQVGSWLPKDKIAESYKSRALGRKEAYEGIELTWKEKKLINDIAKGTVDMEVASRVIASKAFEKLLKFPDSASFTNFIQTELLKLKKQEITDKNTWAMELVNRMFNGELPPRVCPKCGEVLVKLPELVGEVVDVEDVESLPLTRKDP